MQRNNAYARKRERIAYTLSTRTPAGVRGGKGVEEMTVERGDDGRGRRRHGRTPATPLSPSIFSMIFKRASATPCMCMRVYICRCERPRSPPSMVGVVTPGMPSEEEEGRREGGVGGGKALGCPWVERGGLVQRCRWLHEPADR